MSETVFTPPGQEIKAEVPKPLLWRVLIRPLESKAQSEAGIVFTEKIMQDQQFVTQVGQIIECGPRAFLEDKFEGSRLQVGDWVLYPTYGGQNIELADGRKLILMNDDQILAQVDQPELYRKKLV